MSRSALAQFEQCSKCTNSAQLNLLSAQIAQIWQSKGIHSAKIAQIYRCRCQMSLLLCKFSHICHPPVTKIAQILMKSCQPRIAKCSDWSNLAMRKLPSAQIDQIWQCANRPVLKLVKSCCAQIAQCFVQPCTLLSGFALGTGVPTEH